MSEKFEWVCPVCQKSIYHKKSVSRHKKVHAEKTEFICSRCGKVSDRKDNFIRHQKSCKGKVEHKCRVCLKSFQKSYGLKRHQKVHESQKTVKCKNCGNYSNIEDAEQHALVCVKTKHISTEDLDEEFVTMVPRLVNDYMINLTPLPALIKFFNKNIFIKFIKWYLTGVLKVLSLGNSFHQFKALELHLITQKHL